jgi:hypothetical protein
MQALFTGLAMVLALRGAQIAQNPIQIAGQPNVCLRNQSALKDTINHIIQYCKGTKLLGPMPNQGTYSQSTYFPSLIAANQVYLREGLVLIQEIFFPDVACTARAQPLRGSPNDCCTVL